MISDIGNSGARSSGPIGCSVPGCSTGGGGDGRSAIRLYQCFGMRDSSSRYLTLSVIESSPVHRSISSAGIESDLGAREWREP